MPKKIYTIYYSFLSSEFLSPNTKKLFIAPFPTPINKQSIHPASGMVYAITKAVTITIKITMNQFSL